MLLNDYLSQAKGMDEVVAKSRIWLDAHKELRLRIDDARGGINEMEFAIPIFFGKAEEELTMVRPWHHLIFEAEQDLDSACLLLVMGFYKDSFRAMRSFMELMIFALSSFIEEDRQYFSEWLAGKRSTPKFGDLIKKVSHNDNIKQLNRKLRWDVEITNLYYQLSGYMHTRGSQHTNTSLRTSNKTVFSETGISRGMSLLLATMRYTAEGFVAIFPMALQPLPLLEKFAFNPPVGGFLDEGQVSRVGDIFESPALDVLNKIRLSDPEVASLTGWVTSQPDLADTEFFERIMRTLESQEFSSSKEMILGLIKAEKIGQAIACINAMQRAIIRATNEAIFNPFYADLVQPDNEKTDPHV